MKLFYLLVYWMVWSMGASAQEVTDTTVRTRDTAEGNAMPVRPLPAAGGVVRRDTAKTLTGVVRRDSVKQVVVVSPRQSYMALMQTHPYFNFFGKPRHETVMNRSASGKEPLFYLLVSILLYFAFIKLIFRKYLNNLFAFFFKVSMRQKQMREHLMHSPVPALLLNLFFIVSAGVFISFVLRHYQYHVTATIWQLMLYSVLALSVIYLVKLITLKIVGWIFSIKEAVNTYIFVVYSINKLIGIFLIPFVVLLAFSGQSVAQLLITVSFVMIVLLYFYRYMVAYAPVRREIKVSQFHFFLYVCAFEVMPLLLMYKVMIDFLEKSY